MQKITYAQHQAAMNEMIDAAFTGMKAGTKKFIGDHPGCEDIIVAHVQYMMESMNNEFAARTMNT